jgi:ubiquinone/menaquinone biosynthesis C-methylase UbiE
LVTSPPREFKPALNYHGLTGLYDSVVGRAMPERRFKSALIAQADISRGQRVLDFGCGTATLTLMIEAQAPEAEVVGVDVDERALAIAARKAGAVQSRVRFERISQGALPFPDNSFDRVLSCLVFHHLRREEKRLALAECHRILCPGGELHIADWGRPANRFLRGGFFLTQLLDGFETTGDNVRGFLPEFVSQAGFESVEETMHFATVFGSLWLLRARRPSEMY